MKEVKLDNLGRIVIPKQLRNELSLTTSTPLKIYREGDSILITQLKRACAVCGAPITENAELPLCTDCINKAKNIK